MMRKEKRLTSILFVIYLALLTWIILFKMATKAEGIQHLRGINLIPFGKSLITNGRLDTSELLDNVLAFIPFGVYMGMLAKKKIHSTGKKDAGMQGKNRAGLQCFGKQILPVVLVSVAYEVLQYILAVGATDITDVINNTLGGVIGILLYLILKQIFRQKTDWILNGICTVATILGIAFLGVLLAVN